jgi:hypothetical protein
MAEIESCAYHEAGHTVVGYEFGWYLRHGGVRIGRDAAARMRAPSELRTEQAEVVVAMAGWVADAKYLSLPTLVAYNEIVDAIERHRSWLSQCESVSSWGSDPLTVAGEILKADPHINRRAALARVRLYERVGDRACGRRPAPPSAIEPRRSRALAESKLLRGGGGCAAAGFKFLDGRARAGAALTRGATSFCV